jgi:hypothetical protein
MLHELRENLDDLKMEAIYVPKGELDESVRFELTYRGGRLTSLTDSSGVHYELTEKISKNLQSWIGSDGQNDLYRNAKIIAVPVENSDGSKVNIVVAVAVDGGPFFN